MSHIHFASPYFLLLLAILPLLILWYLRKEKSWYVDLQLPTLECFDSAPRTWRQRFRHLLFVFRILALSGFIIALARPQSTSTGQNIITEGIDIVLATDTSGSMLAEDLKPNRIEAAKEVALEFVKGRPNDRIGLVIFGGESFTQCPLTIDHDVVETMIGEVKSGLLEDGTAIGMGLATAVSRLKDSKARSRVIILLTDGVNNTGSIDPLTAAGIAQSFQVRVYTVGVGTQGVAPYPVQTPFGVQYQNMPVEIDEESLKKIATETGGKYFRATDTESLQHIYQEIDQMEKAKIEVMEFRQHSEIFYTTAFPGTVLLLLEALLSQTLFRKIP